jgi:hypothetical protein
MTPHAHAFATGRAGNPAGHNQAFEFGYLDVILCTIFKKGCMSRCVPPILIVDKMEEQAGKRFILSGS